MKYILLFLLFPVFCQAQKLNDEPIDSIIVIDDKIYNWRIFSQYEVIQDTLEMHQRIVNIDAQIVLLNAEKAKLAEKISYFETNKVSSFQQSKQPVKKQPARKPKTKKQ